MGISCCAMLILCLNHIGGLQLYFYFTQYRPFPIFLLCVCHSDSTINFLDCLFSLLTEQLSVHTLGMEANITL